VRRWGAAYPRSRGSVARERALHRYLAACRVDAAHLPHPSGWFAIGSDAEAVDAVRLFARADDPASAYRDRKKAEQVRRNETLLSDEDAA
jgi:hypothetical protein